MKKETRTKVLKRIQMDVLPDQMIKMIDDQQRTGLRKIDPEKADSFIHCSAEWHFARFAGDGASLAPLVYNIMFRVAGDSGNWAGSIHQIARYLNVEYRYALDAVSLLVAAGFLEVLETAQGKATQYRPVSHVEWAGKHPGYCTKKLEKIFPDEDELGKKLFGILGGVKCYPNLLSGLRNTGSTDEQIEQFGKDFMEQDKGTGSTRRWKRFQDYVRSQHTKE
jgi:hypothetical protein